LYCIHALFHFVLGEYLGKTGFFPRDFIEIVPRGDGPQSVPASPASGGAKPVVKRARVQFDYAAEGENEIDLAEGTAPAAFPSCRACASIDLI
jgi:hypothetical protein